MNLQVFSGRSNPELAKDIAAKLDVQLGEIFFHNFPSGESYCQYKTNIRGSDLFLIQGITKPANENLMDLLVMADAARRASAGRITAVVPYFGYARQDRKDKSRVPISAKLVLDLMEASGINRVLTMDLHSPQICGFTNLPFDHLTFEPVLLETLKKYTDNAVIIAPDMGAVKRTEKYAHALKCPMGFISKQRLGDELVSANSFVGNVKGKTAIIVDDMTESCGTLLQAAEICKANGAEKVICGLTHFCLTDAGKERLEKNMRLIGMKNVEKPIDLLFHSNTVPFDWVNAMMKPHEVVTLDVSGLFAKAIHNINKNLSVTELFI